MMDSAARPAILDPRSPYADDLTLLRGPDCESSGLPLLCLPILTRSASLLNLLLQDGTVDLELTSSVVALDPGLALTTLQLANRERRDGDEATWQFPLAVAASGQHCLLQAVNRAPKIESYSSTHGPVRVGPALGTGGSPGLRGGSPQSTVGRRGS